jgi:hypothetical protein
MRLQQQQRFTRCWMTTKSQSRGSSHNVSSRKAAQTPRTSSLQSIAPATQRRTGELHAESDGNDEEGQEEARGTLDRYAGTESNRQGTPRVEGARFARGERNVKGSSAAPA